MKFEPPRLPCQDLRRLGLLGHCGAGNAGRCDRQQQT